MEECEVKAKGRTAYRRFADEAAARTSVYDYLDGKSFLESRETLLCALRELAAMDPPKLEIFDRETFADARRSTIEDLLSEFSR